MEFDYNRIITMNRRKNCLNNMAIPSEITIKNNTLPDSPGVYFYYNRKNELLYIGKATSLKRRVNSYFTKAHNGRIADLVSHIARIDYIEVPTVIEALVLEANQIKAKQPPYNILQRDDKSFLYLVITNEAYPKPLLFRGHDLAKLHINPFAKTLSPEAKKKFLAIYGPYTSGFSLKKALEYLRKIIPWSDCDPPSATGKTRPCFYRHIRKCPGVCTGEIDAKEYRKIIRDLMLFFEGKKSTLIKRLKREMEMAAKEKAFERASLLRDRIHALEHIQDIALITKEDIDLPFSQTRAEKAKIDLEGRIEAYDISNISGTSAVGSMTVFVEGKPAKALYRKFKIKTVTGPNDVAMMQEMIRRRIIRAKNFPIAWPLPEVMVIDGGKPQVNAVQEVLNELQVTVPIIGLAKGFDRKQDQLIYDRANRDLLQVAERGKPIFQAVRDEAHRFAVAYHRKVRAKNFYPKRKI